MYAFLPNSSIYDALACNVSLNSCVSTVACTGLLLGLKISKMGLK